MEKEIFEKKCIECKEMFETPYQIKMRCSECQARLDYLDMVKYGFE